MMAVVVMIMVVMMPVVTFELKREVDAADVEDRRKVHLRILGAMDLRDLVQPADLLLGLIELFGRREVGFVKDDQVGEGDLLARLR